MRHFALYNSRSAQCATADAAGFRVVRNGGGARRGRTSGVETT